VGPDGQGEPTKENEKIVELEVKEKTGAKAHSSLHLSWAY
jgi:hypothetical protein